MSKPVIIAICGKSAAGKDTLQRALFFYLCSCLNNPIQYIISTTTRPPREGEKNGQNYWFISKEEWPYRDFLESTCFRGWWYGTETKRINNKPDAINIGVFNTEGMKKLIYLDRYKIIPIYLKIPWYTRLIRSIKREHKLTLEMLRRMYTDYKDFKSGEKYILSQYDNLLTYTTDDELDSVVNDILGQIQ